MDRRRREELREGGQAGGREKERGRVCERDNSRARKEEGGE